MCASARPFALCPPGYSMATRAGTRSAVNAVNALSAAAIARFCAVDKKTIHNWIHDGKLDAKRTPGGHVRIDAMTAIAFLRNYGFPVPRELSSRRARTWIVAHSPAVRTLVRKALGKRVLLTEYTHVVDALLAFSENPPEALIADPTTDAAYLQPLLQALQKRVPRLIIVYFGNPVDSAHSVSVPHATPGELSRTVLELLGCAK
jgi:excisionase family DNA binding protein